MKVAALCALVLSNGCAYVGGDGKVEQVIVEKECLGDIVHEIAKPPVPEPPPQATTVPLPDMGR